MNKKIEIIRRLKSWISSITSSGYSGCQRCKTKWGGLFKAKYHVTYYCENKGCFPLCQICWEELTPIQRLSYYKILISEWLEYNTVVEFDEILQIHKAVLEGK